jgi:hypothetical protein
MITKEFIDKLSLEEERALKEILALSQELRSTQEQIKKLKDYYALVIKEYEIDLQGKKQDVDELTAKIQSIISTLYSPCTDERTQRLRDLVMQHQDDLSRIFSCVTVGQLANIIDTHCSPKWSQLMMLQAYLDNVRGMWLDSNFIVNNSFHFDFFEKGHELLFRNIVKIWNIVHLNRGGEYDV